MARKLNPYDTRLLVHVETYQDGGDKSRSLCTSRTIDVVLHATSGRRTVALRILRAASAFQVVDYQLANERAAHLLLRQDRAGLADEPLALYALRPAHLPQVDVDEAMGEASGTPELGDEAQADAVDVDPTLPRANEILLSELADTIAQDTKARLVRRLLDMDTGTRLEDVEAHSRPVSVADYRTWRLVLHLDRIEAMGGLQPLSIAIKYHVLVTFTRENRMRIWKASFENMQVAEACKAAFEEHIDVFKYFAGWILRDPEIDHTPQVMQKKAAIVRNREQYPTYPAAFKRLLDPINGMLLGHWTLLQDIAGADSYLAPPGGFKDLWCFNLNKAEMPE